MDLIDKLIWNKARRIKDLENFAVETGWSFTKEEEHGLLDQLKQFKLFQRGTSKKIQPILKINKKDAQFRLFDYQFVVSTGKSSHTYRQTVFFMESKQLALPQFYQKPELFFDKIISYFGWEDIDFQKFPEYSERYHLKGDYDAVIRFFFSDTIIQLLTQQKSLYMEGMHYYFIIYRKSKIIPYPSLPAFVDLSMLLSNLFLDRSEESHQFLNLNLNIDTV